MSWPLGYVAADVGGRAPEVLAAELAAIGYEAVDWTMEQYDPLDEAPAHLVRLVGVAADNGLAVPQLMVHQDYVVTAPAQWEARVRRSERAIEAAAEAGVPTVGLVTGPNRWVAGWQRVGTNLSARAAWDLVLRALERVLERAQASGVRAALEPCWGTLAWNAAATDRLLGRLGSDSLSLNLDPSHFVMSGDDPAALARRWGPRIAHVHLKDAFGLRGVEGEDFCFLLPGEGRTDWPAFLGALEAIGYSGATSVEFESFRLRDQVLGGDVEAGARLAHEFVRGLLRARIAG